MQIRVGFQARDDNSAKILQAFKRKAGVLLRGRLLFCLVPLKVLVRDELKAEFHATLQTKSGCKMDAYAVRAGSPYRQNPHLWGDPLTPTEQFIT